MKRDIDAKIIKCISPNLSIQQVSNVQKTID